MDDRVKALAISRRDLAALIDTLDEELKGFYLDNSASLTENERHRIKGIICEAAVRMESGEPCHPLLRPTGDKFWDKVEEISDQQRQIPKELRSMSGVPRGTFHTDRLPTKKDKPDG